MEAATGERAGAAVLIGIGDYLLEEQVWPLRYACATRRRWQPS